MADLEDLDDNDEAYFSDGIDSHSLSSEDALRRLQEKLVGIEMQGARDNTRTN